jgi:hypothetical protein
LIVDCVERRADLTQSPEATKWELLVLDIVSVLGVLALFALVGLIGKAVERL